MLYGEWDSEVCHRHADLLAVLRAQCDGLNGVERGSGPLFRLHAAAAMTAGRDPEKVQANGMYWSSPPNNASVLVCAAPLSGRALSSSA